MQFGKAIGTACATFAVTNIDDMFVLVTFFAEAASSKTITPLKITLGQYLGFTVIIIISMAGFGASLILPSEPIGFLGLLPMLLGVWKFLEILIPSPEDNEEEITSTRFTGWKSVFKVSIITVMNGGDNIGTYIPLFSQAKGAEIAVYVVVYYILLGVWCLVASLVMRQRHILALLQKYVAWLIPALYVGIGLYVVVKSSCYPWSIEHINDATSGHQGRMTMAVATTFLLSVCICVMVLIRLRKKARRPTPDVDIPVAEIHPSATEDAIETSHQNHPTDIPPGKV